MSLDRFMDGVRKEKKEERGEKRVELVWRRGRLFGICHICDRVYLMG